MAIENDKVKDLYNFLRDEGYDFMGSESDFREKVSDSNSVNSLHDFLRDEGYDFMGTREDFYGKLNPADTPVSSTDQRPKAATQQHARPEQVYSQAGGQNGQTYTPGRSAAQTPALQRPQKAEQRKPAVTAPATPASVPTSTRGMVEAALGKPADTGFTYKGVTYEDTSKFVQGIPQQKDTVDLAESIVEDSKQQADAKKAKKERQDTTRSQVDELSNSIDEQMQDWERRAKTALEDKMKSDANIAPRSATSLVRDVASYMATKNRSNGPVDVNYNTPEIKALTFAKRSLDNAKNMIAEADHNAAGGFEGSFVAGVGRGFGQKFTDLSTWDFGASDLVDATTFLRILEKADKGEALSKSEQALLDAKVIEIATSEYFGDEVGRGYKAGSVTAESIPFMIEMMVNPIAGAGQGAEKMLARYALKRFARKGIAEGATKTAALRAAKKSMEKGGEHYVAGRVASGVGRAVGDVLAAPGIAATTGSLRTAADAVNRRIGDVQFKTDTDGRSVYDYRKDAASWFDAWRKAFLSTSIENYSEMFGNYFSPLLGAAGKGAAGIATSRFGKALRLDKVYDMLNNVSSSDWARLVSDFENRANWHGTLGEFSEELVGGVLNAILVGDQTLDTDKQTGVFNLDNLIDTFLGVSLMGGAFSAVNTGGYALGRHRLNRADAAGRDTFGEEWDMYQSSLSSEDDAIVKQTLKSIAEDKNLSEDQKKAAFRYANAAYGFRTVLSQEEKRREDPETDPAEQAVRDSFANGYDAGAEEQRDIMIEAGMGEPTEARQAAADGVRQRIEDDADMEVEGWREEGRKMMHSDGSIRPAVLKVKNENGEDTEVYIVEGNVQMMADGTMVDPETSDRSVVIYDPATGERKMIEPTSDMGILSIGEATSAEDFEYEIQRRRDEYVQRMLDEAQGTVRVELGQSLTMPDGREGTVMAISPDGESFTVVANDCSGEVRMERSDLQQVADAAALADYQARHQEDEATAEQPTEEETDEPTAVAPGIVEGAPAEFLPDMRLMVRDDDGETKEAVVQGRVRYDGGQFVPDENGQIVEYMMDGEVHHDQIPTLSNKTDGYIEAPVAVPEETEQTEGAEAVPQPTESQEQAEVQQEESTVPAGESAETATAPAAAVEPMPMRTVRRKIDGKWQDVEEEDWMSTTPARAYKYLYEEAVGLGLPIETVDNLVKSNLDNAQRGVERAKKATGSIVSVLQKQRDAQAVVDYWQQVQSLRNQQLLAEAEARDAATREERERRRAETKAARKRDQEAYEAEMARRKAEQEKEKREQESKLEAMAKIGEESRAMGIDWPIEKDAEAMEVMNDIVPHTLEEVAAWMLGDTRGGYKIDPDAIRAHTGYGTADMNKFPFVFAKGGMSPEAFGEKIEQRARENDVNFDESDTNAGYNALLNVLGEAGSLGDLKNYIKNNRMAQAEEIHSANLRREASAQAEDRWIAQHGGMTREEYESYINWMEDAVEMGKMAITDEEYNQLFNTDHDRRTETNDEGSDQRGAEEGSADESEAGQAAAAADDTRGDGEETEPAASPVAEAIAQQEVEENPTEGQKEAGNYKKAHVKVDGLDITIENKKGSTRSGVDPNGRAWSQTMNNNYGYILGTEGVDGDNIDMFLSDTPEQGDVFVVDQVNPKTGEFDEHKVMYGFPDIESAKAAYLSNYEEGWQGCGAITPVSKEEFKKWIESSHRKTKPFAEYASVKTLGDVQVENMPAEEHDSERGAYRPITNEWFEIGDNVGAYENGKVYHGDIIDWDGEKFTIRETISRRNGKYRDHKAWPINIKPGSKKATTKPAATAEEQPTEEQRVIGQAMVDQLENMGMEVSTDISENRRVHRQAEQDNSEAGKLRHFRTSDGNVYGFSYRGKIYIDPRRIDAELPIHEYAHPWCEAFRMLNPEGWQEVVDMMQGDKETWNLVQRMNPDLTDANDIAEEMIAIGSGKNGKARAEAEYRRMGAGGNFGNVWNNIAKSIQDFWKRIGDFLGIKYESTAQVYDQVVKDFANKVNPRKRIENYLKERDNEYMQAVESGDEAKAKDLFDAALRENIGNGMTPYVAAGGYRGSMDRLARGVKSRDPKVVTEVADLMAPLIPDNAILVPAPSHSGTATDMLDVANAIAERTGAPVADVLKSEARESQYESKRESGRPITATQMGITMTGELPDGMLPVVIDNVVNSGNTAEACVKALGKGVVVSLADAADRRKHVSSLKSANVVALDKNGNVVPLSQRFTLGGSNYLAKQKGEQGNRVSEVTKALRDGLVSLLRSAGLDVVANKREGQRMLDKYRELAKLLRVWHGSGADFDRFDHSKMGTGEGAQAFGYGTYVTEVKGIGKNYAEKIGKKRRNYNEILESKNLTNEDRAVVNDINKEPFALSEKEKVERLKARYEEEIKKAEENVKSGTPILEAIDEAMKIIEEMTDLEWEKYSENKSGRLAELDDYLSENVGFIEFLDEKAREQALKTGNVDRETALSLHRQAEELNREAQEKLKSLSWISNALSRYGRILYEVEIPDDNGSNYLDYDGYVTEAQYPMWYEAMKELGEEDHFATPEKHTPSKDGNTSVSVGFEIKAMGNRYTSEAVSKALHDAGFTGIKYPAQFTTGGREDNAKNYVIFDENDLKITDKIRFHKAEDGEYEPEMEGDYKFFKTPDGEVYGFTVGGEIYIDPSVATAETPIHEYTHLWAQALRKANPQAWERLKEEMKAVEGGRLWEYVKSKYPELEQEDELMEEVFAHYSGRRGAERLESDMREAMAQEPDLTLKAQVALVFHKLRDALQKFWTMARDLFAGKVEGLEGMTAEDFADMALGDLLRGFDPRVVRSEREEKTLINPRNTVPNVRGGWNERKIKDYLKHNSTRSGVYTAARAISEFDNVEELKDHMFYHGTVYGGEKLKPSITMSERDAERYGGGGYGERYWGISLTKSKKVASHFSGMSNSMKIYPVILLKGAKVVERPDMEDAADLEGHIVELWNDGVDAVWIGKGKQGEGEQELCVINPRAVVNIGTPDFYNVYQLGTKENPLRISDDAAIKKMYETAKEYASFPKPNKPFKPIKPSRLNDKLEWKSDEEYAAEMDAYEQKLSDYEQRMEEYNNSEELRKYEEMQDKARKDIRYQKAEKQDMALADLLRGFNPRERTAVHREGEADGDISYGDWFDQGSVERIGAFMGDSRKRIDAMKERQKASVRKRLEEQIEKMGLKDRVVMVESADELGDVSEEDRRSKGWYDVETGKIVIVLDNHTSSDDVIATILHEGVAHYGLRQLFGKHFDTFLDNVYASATEEVRGAITNLAANKYGWNIREATEEYIAGLAEDTDFESPERQSWWAQIKHFFWDMLHKLGIAGQHIKDAISDNELRYLLWRSYQNLVNPGRYRSLVEEAEDIAMQWNLQVGRYEERYGELHSERAGRWYAPARAAESGINLDEVEKIEARPEADGYVSGVSVRLTMTDGNTYNLWVQTDTDDGQRGVTEFYGNDDEGVPDEEMTQRFGRFFGHDVNEIFGSRIGFMLLESARVNRNGITLNREQISQFKQPSKAAERMHRDGDFSPRDNAIARDYYERMVSQNGYQVQEAMQDSMLGLRKAMQAILGAGKDFKIEEVAGNENAYLAENRMSSTNAAEQHNYFRQWLEPLLKAVHELAGSKAAEREALTNYMMAKHGLERNEKFAERDFVAYQQQYPTGGKTLADFRQNDYAGLTALTGEQDVVDAEAVARQMVADYEALHDTSELWDAVNTATKVTLAKMYRGGLMSKESYEHTRDMFEYYIPLRGFDETTSDEVYGYLTSRQGPLGSSILKHAEGRRSKADDPIATIAMMADQAIMQANRNEMKQRFLTFVQNHPSDLVSVSKLWLQYDAAADEWVPVFADIDEGDTAADVARKVEAFEQRMEQLAANDPDNYKSGKEAANIPYRVLPGNMNEHQVLVKRAGETFVLTINGNPRAAQALNGLTNPDVKTGGFIGGFMKASSTINRFLSSAYTTRTPDFVVSNFFRDMLYSNCMAWVKDTPSYALRFHKNFGRFNPVTMRVLFGKWENGKLDDSKPTEYMFKQFMMNGGETGYTNVRDIEAQKRRIVKELRRQGSAPRKVLHVLGEQLDLVNQSVENCARFAAFITSQELGRSIERSIYDAKEVSVNFNKKGSGDKMMGAEGQTKIGNVAAFLSGAGRCLQVFWNAGVQGMTNFGRAAKRKPGKFAAASATMFTLGAVIPLIAKALAGDGDDDDKNAYYNLPEYVRRSNICFRVGDSWITIPLPIEFRAIYGLGELGTGVITGEEHYSDGELARQMVAQVSQILPLDFMEGQGGLHNLWPSWAKPLVEGHNNKGWTGLPIYRDTPFNQSDPEFTKVYKSADKHIVAASKWLNEITGGDDYKKGWADVVNPAQVEYVLNGYFGGYFKVPNQLIKMTETATGNREFEWRNMMIANRLIKSGDERTAHRKLQNEYFKYKEEYEETKRLKKKYEKAADEGVVGYAEKVNFLNNSEEYARYLIFDEYRKDINDLYNLQKEETDEEKRKEYEAEYYQVMREMVDAMHAYEKSKGK